MLEKYQLTEPYITAEHLVRDVYVTVQNNGVIHHLIGVPGNYLIRTSGGRIFVLGADVFEALFKNAERNQNGE